MAGILSCLHYFDADIAEEHEIRDLADKLFRRVDWNWALNGTDALSMGWHPESGKSRYFSDYSKLEFLSSRTDTMKAGVLCPRAALQLYLSSIILLIQHC